MHTFYYDETEHSRKITRKTVSASEFYDGFIAVIVGWDNATSNVYQKMAEFKEKHRQRQSKKGEIKSKTLSNEELRCGFATLKTDNITLIRDFLSIFDKDTCLYIFSASKMEYIVRQSLWCYRFVPYVNVNALVYTISKAVVLYSPPKVLEQIEGAPEQMLREIIVFLKSCIRENQSNASLKSSENKAFLDTVSVLQKYSLGVPPSIEWDYTPAFNGFAKYLREKEIKDYALIVDKEGKKQKTLCAAKAAGILKSSEDSSENHLGIQIADFMAGIIRKLMKSIYENLKYTSQNDGVNRKLLDEKWFDLNENQFELYKQLHKIICEWDHAWYKTYSGLHSDDFVTFIALLDYICQFDSVEQMEAHSGHHNECFNELVCEYLQIRFEG